MAAYLKSRLDGYLISSLLFFQMNALREVAAELFARGKSLG